MLKWLGIIVRTLWSILHTHRVLATENLVLRQQLAVLKQRHPRPRLTDAERLFWVTLSATWSVHENGCLKDAMIKWERQHYKNSSSGKTDHPLTVFVPQRELETVANILERSFRRILQFRNGFKAFAQPIERDTATQMMHVVQIDITDYPAGKF